MAEARLLRLRQTDGGGGAKPNEHADARVDGIKATVLAREEAQQVCRAPKKIKKCRNKIVKYG